MSRFAHILAFVQEEIARREALPAGVMTPSDYWRDYNGFSSYVRTLPDEELKYIRRHTWHLTGDRYDSYLFASNRLRRRVIKQYESMLPRLGDFRPQEPTDGIGLDTQYGRLNSGILRYSVALGDLISAGLLSRSNAPRVLEIGGGYGGLALLCLQYNPRISYVVCDLEESLFIQGVFLSRHLGADKVRLGLPAAPEPGVVCLVPQTRAEGLAGLRFDFAVNQQSMQEMTQLQVEHYAELLAKCAAKFYSCNRSSHGAGVVRDKGLVANLHETLGKRFAVLWDSTDQLSALARACVRNKVLRKLVTAFIGKSFLPVGEAALRRFVYRGQA